MRRRGPLRLGSSENCNVIPKSWPIFESARIYNIYNNKTAFALLFVLRCLAVKVKSAPVVHVHLYPDTVIRRARCKRESVKPTDSSNPPPTASLPPYRNSTITSANAKSLDDYTRPFSLLYQRVQLFRHFQRSSVRLYVVCSSAPHPSPIKQQQVFRSFTIL